MEKSIKVGLAMLALLCAGIYLTYYNMQETYNPIIKRDTVFESTNGVKSVKSILVHRQDGSVKLYKY